MTLIEVMIVLAVIALIMGVLVGPRVIAEWRRSRIEVARLQARDYAAAYARWSLDHQAACPEQLEDLRPYVNKQALTDPWGQRFVMRCGEGAGPGELQFAVVSLGPDGQEGTADDIHSWDEQ